MNAFRGMLGVADRLAAFADKLAGRRTRFSITPEAARSSVLLLGGEMSGGHNFDVVPDRVSFTVDRRTNSEEDFDVERCRLLEVVEQARTNGCRVDVEIMQEGRSAATSARGQLARALDASIRSATGTPARFELCPGVLETRHYVALGIPALA